AVSPPSRLEAPGAQVNIVARCARARATAPIACGGTPGSGATAQNALETRPSGERSRPARFSAASRQGASRVPARRGAVVESWRYREGDAPAHRVDGRSDR